MSAFCPEIYYCFASYNTKHTKHVFYTSLIINSRLRLEQFNKKLIYLKSGIWRVIQYVNFLISTQALHNGNQFYNFKHLLMISPTQ